MFGNRTIKRNVDNKKILQKKFLNKHQKKKTKFTHPPFCYQVSINFVNSLKLFTVPSSLATSMRAIHSWDEQNGNDGQPILGD